MAAIVRWTELAARELDDAAAYIATDSSAYAAAFVRNVLRAVELLADWPDSGAIVPEFDDPAFREIFVRPYRIIYRVEDRAIVVVAFIHGARDLPRLWKPEERDSSE